MNVAGCLQFAWEDGQSPLTERHLRLLQSPPLSAEFMPIIAAAAICLFIPVSRRTRSLRVVCRPCCFDRVINYRPSIQFVHSFIHFSLDVHSLSCNKSCCRPAWDTHHANTARPPCSVQASN